MQFANTPSSSICVFLGYTLYYLIVILRCLSLVSLKFFPCYVRTVLITFRRKSTNRKRGTRVSDIPDIGMKTRSLIIGNVTQFIIIQPTAAT